MEVYLHTESIGDVTQIWGISPESVPGVYPLTPSKLKNVEFPLLKVDGRLLPGLFQDGKLIGHVDDA